MPQPHTRRAPLVLTTTLAMLACAEPTAGPRPDAPAFADRLITCSMDISARAMRCGGGQKAADGLALSVVVGSQGTNVELASSAVGYNSGTQIFQADVTVENLLGQAIGTTDGTTPDPEGVRVFFHGGPTVTAGTGTVTVDNADGTATFTAAGQSYFQYNGILQPSETSDPLTWRWNVPTTVTTFDFTVLVSAPTQFSGDWLELLPTPVFLPPGGSAQITTIMRNVLGRPVPLLFDATVNQMVSDPAVISASTFITIPTAQSSAINTVTALDTGSADLSASMGLLTSTVARVWVTTFAGTWAVTPTVAYSCATGLVDIDMSSLVATYADPELRWTPASSTIGLMKGSFDPAGTFTVQRVIAGGLTETYTLTGTFTSPTAFTGTLSATFTGTLTGTGCSNQTWQVSGSR